MGRYYVHATRSKLKNRLSKGSFLILLRHHQCIISFVMEVYVSKYLKCIRGLSYEVNTDFLAETAPDELISPNVEQNEDGMAVLCNFSCKRPTSEVFLKGPTS